MSPSPSLLRLGLRLLGLRLRPGLGHHKRLLTGSPPQPLLRVAFCDKDPSVARYLLFGHASPSSSSSSPSSPSLLRIPLLPSTPVLAPLMRIAAGAPSQATIVSVYSNSSDTSVSWCPSTPVVEIISDALLTNASVEIHVAAPETHDGSVSAASRRIPLSLPTLNERAAPLRAELAQIRQDLEPLDRVKRDSDAACRRSTTRYIWCGLGALCVQWGAMARLTWWEYSWDVMEPIAYFMTFGTGIAGYLFFVLTRREYTYEVLEDLLVSRRQRREYERRGLDVARYTRLLRGAREREEQIARVEAQHPAMDSRRGLIP